MANGLRVRCSPLPENRPLVKGFERVRTVFSLKPPREKKPCKGFQRVSAPAESEVNPPAIEWSGTYPHASGAACPRPGVRSGGVDASLAFMRGRNGPHTALFLAHRCENRCGSKKTFRLKSGWSVADHVGRTLER